MLILSRLITAFVLKSMLKILSFLLTWVFQRQLGELAIYKLPHVISKYEQDIPR